MFHFLSENCLKVKTTLVPLICFLTALLCFSKSAPVLSSDDIHITRPQNGFYVNRHAATAFPVIGQARTGKAVSIFANSVPMGTAITDESGVFSINVDFSGQIEGPVILHVLQDGKRSISVSGIYDATPPRITTATINDRAIIVSFNESNLQYVAQERNYRFSPSLIFRTIGGADDIDRIDDFSYRLMMRSIPQDEVIYLSLTGITDAAGNVAAPTQFALNDRDNDRIADLWEVQHGLNPVIADAVLDADGDEFTNYQEYLARSHPSKGLSAPIEISDTIPQEDAGIVNFAQVPDRTSVALLIRSVHGIDLNEAAAVHFNIDDSIHSPYRRDLSHDAVRVIKLSDQPDERVNYFWVSYDRFLEPIISTTYSPDAVVQVSVSIRDTENNAFHPEPIEFKIESATHKAASIKNLPIVAEFYESEPASGDDIDTSLVVVDGEPAGAEVHFSSLEPLTPEFGDPNELPAIVHGGMLAAGAPVNLLPHTVFDRPVTLFIPVYGGVDIRKVGLAYYDGIQWLQAADEDGVVLPAGEGWMVPGSRIDHPVSSPPLIEVQVYHFSATQAVLLDGSGSATKDDRSHSSGSNANVYISCFINSVNTDWSLGPVGLIVMLILFGILLLFQRLRCKARRV